MLVSYKPGWTITWLEQGAGIVRVTVEHFGLDSDGSGKTLLLASSHEGVARSDDDLKQLIADAVAYVEKHESQEWLRFDGVQLVNPHARSKQ